MNRYNLTIARPAGFLHSSAFIEVRDSLGWALAELGHEVNSTENFLCRHEDMTNILFGAETLSGQEEIPPNTILYNLEQPSHPRMGLVRNLARGRQVWDFSASNVKEWQAAGYEAHWLPIAYTPHLTRIPQTEKQDIDVFFAGWLTPRRLEMKRRLEDLGLKAVFTDAAYGGGRDYLIAHAKVCLNVHHDGRDMTEIVRLAYLLANRKAVISETASDDNDYRHLGLSLWSYEHLTDAVRLAVNDVKLRLILERQGFERFQKIRLGDHLKRVLDEAHTTPSKSSIERATT